MSREDLEKQGLLDILRNQTYCRISRSNINGVGVVAIKDIPQGVDPFFGAKYQKHLGLSESELAGLDEEVRQMILGFFVFEEGLVWVPKGGLNNINISYYMNHSKTPNVEFSDGTGEFQTIREIKKGEELTIDYKKFDESEPA